MTGDEFRQRLAAIEAKANMAYGARVNRRTGNGGRYWALGSVIAEMSCHQWLGIVDAWVRRETEALELEFYSQQEP
jgi:hypothetical protein